ncbi:Periplasmic serine endoprotease DegP precursor [Pseudobythopirellula maris]|uniref:Periplasmic serine endoprotease DegP n=1 Tax=Pseudobythopirellula maris TaxID=2527991 RepID=A0A5C5ZJX9_9BACT|nr:serine protease [Pseudobythopirellula maris]TWT87662.1 Periplasmic serine endoprotease DegP precursor [Pseudobythopirellula maris]
MSTLTQSDCRRVAIALGAFSLLAAVAPAALADAANYRQTLDSTTWVLAKNSEGTSSGTGVLVDAERKLVLTNAHVVGDSRNAVLFFRDLKEDRPVVEKSHYLKNVRKLGVRGRIVAVDRKRDLALLQLDRLPEGAKAIELAEKSTSPGTGVDSIGNPGTSDALWVYTSGTVRAVYKKQFRTGVGEHEFTVVETQSPINTGDSGGPVVDATGKLIGVSQAIAKRGNLVSYCVDVTEIRDFLESPWKPAPLPVADLLTSTGLKYEKHTSGNFKIDVELKDSLEQGVFITSETEYYERADVRKIWSLAATLDAAPTAETTLRLLEQNARTKLGAWSVEQNPSGGYLVIYLVKMDATATSEALRSTIEYAAKITSEMAKELKPKETAQTASETLDSWLAE